MPGPRGRSRFEAGGLWDRCGTPWKSQAGLSQKGTLMWVSRRCRAAGPVGGPEASRDHARPPGPPWARPPRVSSPRRRRRQQVFSPALGAHTGLRLREEPGVPHRVWGGQQGRLHRLGSLLGLSCTVPDGVSVRQASLGPQGLQGGLSAAQWMPVFDMEIWAVRMDAAQQRFMQSDSF